jgi:hypothetical protein
MDSHHQYAPSKGAVLLLNDPAKKLVPPLGGRSWEVGCVKYILNSKMFAIPDVKLDKVCHSRHKLRMVSIKTLPLPARHALEKLGRDLALARRKRRISTLDMAARLFVTRDTLWRMERGDPSVSVGTLATASFILQLHDRLANLAAPETDKLALSLEEELLPKRIRHRSK